MEMIKNIQNSISKDTQNVAESNQQEDQAPKTNENQVQVDRLSDEALMEIYGTVHMFI